MLAELRITLETDGEISYKNTPQLHGVIMERISTEYADKLHQTGLNPYSQHLEKDESGRPVWCIKTLNDEAYEKIILEFLKPGFNSFEITKTKTNIRIIDKKLTTLDNKELLKEFYDGEAVQEFNITFLTATGFKSNEAYLIYPDLRLMYKSLMNKYSASSEISMFDEETLDQLVDSSAIIGYRLRSTTFPVEGIKIPSFIGEIKLKIYGNKTLAKYVGLLLKFGEYSGIGIKAGMGMGAYRLERKKEKE